MHIAGAPDARTKKTAGLVMLSGGTGHAEGTMKLNGGQERGSFMRDSVRGGILHRWMMIIFGVIPAPLWIYYYYYQHLHVPSDASISILRQS